MFVSAEVDLDIDMSAAQAGLASLAHDGSLLSTSAAAYARGNRPTDIDSPGPATGATRLVGVHARDLTRLDGSAGLAVRWEAIGPDGELFPALDADVTLTPGDGVNTVLALKGVYRPVRSTGVRPDDEFTRRAADTTVGAFIDSVAAYLTRTASIGGSRNRFRAT